MVSYQATLLADLVSLPDVRHEVRAWLHDRGLSEKESFDLVLATHEAVAAVVDRSAKPGRVVLSARAVGDEITVTVTCFSAPAESQASKSDNNREIGLDIIRVLVDELVIHAGPTSTTFTLRHLGKRTLRLVPDPE